MKYLLASLLLPSLANAQHIDLAIQGGLCTPNGFIPGTNGRPGYIFSVKPAIHLGKLMVGAGADAHQMIVRANDINHTGDMGQPLPRTIRYGNPQLAFHAFGNYKFRIPKGYVYTGISGGYSTFTFNNKEFYQYRIHHSGFMAGVQTGIHFNLTKRLGAGGEFAPRYYSLNTATDTDNGRRPRGSEDIFAYPVLVGVRVKLL